MKILRRKDVRGEWRDIASGVSPGAHDQSDEKAGGLKQCLRIPDLIAYSVNNMVGAGIFVVIGAATLQAGSGIVMSFFIAALICVLSGLCFAEFIELGGSPIRDQSLFDFFEKHGPDFTLNFGDDPASKILGGDPLF